MIAANHTAQTTVYVTLALRLIGSANPDDVISDCRLLVDHPAIVDSELISYSET